MNGFKSTMLHRTAFLLPFGLTVFSGCAPGNPWDATHPVSGSIEYKGKSIENAELTLFTLDQSAPDTVRPKGKTGADGKFVLGTYTQNDGAPIGKYKVTVVRNEISVSRDTIVAKPNDLPQKYANLSSTDLEVEITAGQNELPAIILR